MPPPLDRYRALYRRIHSFFHVTRRGIVWGKSQRRELRPRNLASALNAARHGKRACAVCDEESNSATSSILSRDKE
jgi:hypothetical protein